MPSKRRQQPTPPRQRQQPPPPPPPIPATSLVGQPASIYVKNPTYNIYILNSINPHFANMSDGDLYSICYRPIHNGARKNYHLPNDRNQTIMVFHYSNYRGSAVNYNGSFFFAGIDVRDIAAPMECDRSRHQWHSADRTIFPELGPNLGFLIFGEGQHSGGADVSNQYRVNLADTTMFPDFQIGRDIVLGS